MLYAGKAEINNNVIETWTWQWLANNSKSRYHPTTNHSQCWIDKYCVNILIYILPSFAVQGQIQQCSTFNTIVYQTIYKSGLTNWCSFFIDFKYTWADSFLSEGRHSCGKHVFSWIISPWQSYYCCSQQTSQKYAERHLSELMFLSQSLLYLYTLLWKKVSYLSWMCQFILKRCFTKSQQSVYCTAT